MDEVLTLAQKLGGVSFATLMVFILIGSYLDVWVWGKAHREVKAERDEYKRMLHSALGVLDISATGNAQVLAEIARRRG
jgi:hypothetical protein